MIQSTSFRRCALPAVSALAIAFAALLDATAPAVGQDETSNPNVIVDESALDGPPEGGASETGLLPPPALKPVSRLVKSGEGAIEAQSPPETAAETTFAAVPTTPIEATDLDGSEDFSVETETSPAAGGEDDSSAPDEAAEASPPAGDDAEAAASEAVPEASAEAEQTAARPPIEGMVRIPFEPEAYAIPEAAQAGLADLVEQLDADYGLRLQVLAYAAGDEDESTHARGVSLARALAMRDYLSDQGIGVDRMDIKALGNTAQEEPADRVDLIPVAQ